MQIENLFDPRTYTLTYIVWDEETKKAVIIDPVYDYDQASSKLYTESLDKLDAKVKELGVTPEYCLETHAHADHLTSSQKLKELYSNIKVGIGENIKLVQEVFKGVFSLDDLKCDGSQFEHLLKDGEVLNIGNLNIKVMNTPGHTPACVSYLINGKAVFTGDCLFLEDYGTGRCDFPKGSAHDLYQSVQKLYALDDDIEVYTGHDYQPGGRELRWKTTIGISKEKNIQLKANTPEDEYVKFRTERDATLQAPKLLLPSVQFNVAAGNPPRDANGISYLKIPLNDF